MASSDDSNESSSDSIQSTSLHNKTKGRNRHFKYGEDSPYVGSVRVLPTSTSHWTVNCLDSLRIFYDDYCQPSPTSILDMIFDETGLFGQLNGEEKEKVAILTKTLNFSTSIRTMLKGSSFIPTLDLEGFVTEMKNDIMNIRKQQSGRKTNTMEEDFITNVQLMIAYQAGNFIRRGIRSTQGAVPEAIFVDIFRTFAKICNLLPVPGEAWIGKMSIYHGVKHVKIPVESAADLVLFPESYTEDLLDTLGNGNTASSVVSVEELKNLKYIPDKGEERQKSRSSQSQSSGSEISLAPEPEIYQKIKKEVLGQHGGELLLHHQFYRNRLCGGKRYVKCMPGIIVVGTEITFTLLKITADHVYQLESKDKLTPDNKATIYYSNPMDLLDKADRDILMESFFRLNKV